MFLYKQYSIVSIILCCIQTTWGFPLKQDRHVYHHMLKNGMHILVRKIATIPKVSLQLWYHVGSKDEELGEKGIAHLLEHMIFKGTAHLGESDLDAIVHKLSGSCNAFTSYDYTGYLFNVPSAQYKTILPIMADCMENVRFDDQMLNSEMKAVIQELKMGKDQYVSRLIEHLFSAIFYDHPYHYPIIGFKHDLFSVNAADLSSFYKKHYAPNNATLVVVGDVDPNEVFGLAEGVFGTIRPIEGYAKKSFYHEEEIGNKSVTLFRDVQLPMYLFAFVIPGLSKKQEHLTELVEWIIGKGNGSRLYKRLVNELQYVASLEVGSWTLFDHGLFFIACDPVEGVSKDQIKQVIIDELFDIVHKGVTDAECTRAYKKAQSSFYALLEDYEDQAYAIGQNFLATNDPEYIFNCMESIDILKPKINAYISHYLRYTLMHEGLLLPLPTSELTHANQLQSISDKQDTAILSGRPRTTPVEAPTKAADIMVSNPVPFTYKTYETVTLDNGIRVLYASNEAIPKISIVVSLAAESHHDPDGKEGLYTFITALMTEKTKRFTADQLAEYIESKGMSLSVYPGCILVTCLRDDLVTAIEVLSEVLTNAVFEPADIEKIRIQLISDLKNYWDDPRSFASYLVKKQIYAGHPYAKNMLGTFESLKSITREDLCAYYKKFITPDRARIAIVGDIAGYDIKQIISQGLSTWQNTPAMQINFPSLQPHKATIQNYAINRDQVVLCFARPSINRYDDRYDALQIFDQIFGAGMLASMHSRLFSLRQASGLFYTINGTFLASVDENGGMFLVKTLVSKDRLDEARKVIVDTIITAADTISDEEFIEAKRAIAYGIMDNFSSSISMARTFLYLDKYQLPKNYFHNRFADLQAITKADVQKAVKEVLGNHEFFILQIGRL